MAVKPYPQIVLFGDSLFQGACAVQDGFSFQAELQCHANRRMDVINRGFSGYNTSQALKILPELFSPPGPNVPRIAYLLVLLGANDAVIPMPTTEQHVPLDNYRANLKAIITDPIITAHRPKILLITPPPLDQIKVTKLDISWGHPAATRESKISSSYCQAAREVAAEVDGVVLIDLEKAIQKKAMKMCPEFSPKDAKKGPWLGDPETGLQGGLDALLPDGLHMSGEAYRVLYNEVFPHISPEWNEMDEKMDRTGYMFDAWTTAAWLDKDKLN